MAKNTLLKILLGSAVMLAILAAFFATRNKESEFAFADEPSGEDLEIWFASDLHYLSPELRDNGEKFQTILANGDGKMTENSKELLDAFCTQVMEKKPDALVLSGDLTFNGEQESLEELAAQLEAIEATGIPVLVLPGNHDIDYPYAYRYVKDQAIEVDNISEAEFRAICGRFGYDEALKKDRHSLSYLHPLSAEVGLLCLDANTSRNSGKISDSTLQWAQKQLAWAKEEGMEIITISHQNLLPQNILLYQGYTLENNEDVIALLQDYGVTHHLSGHSHLWHQTIQDGLSDRAIGSLSVAPLGYAILTIEPSGNIAYHQERLDLLQKEASDRFDQITRKQVQSVLSALFLDEETHKKMEDFAVELNRTYFSGQLEDKEKIKASEGWKLWEEKGKDTFWYLYLYSIVNGN